MHHSAHPIGGTGASLYRIQNNAMAGIVAGLAWCAGPETRKLGELQKRGECTCNLKGSVEDRWQ
jgi:hypothetical protein